MVSSKRLAIFLLLLVFVLGFATGSLITSIVVHKASGNVLAGKPAAPAKKGNEVDKLSDELQLNPEQKGHLCEIIGKSRDRYRQLSKEYSPRCDEIRNQTEAAIMQILNMEQKQRFQKHIDQEQRNKQAQSSQDDD